MAVIAVYNNSAFVFGSGDCIVTASNCQWYLLERWEYKLYLTSAPGQKGLDFVISISVVVASIPAAS